MANPDAIADLLRRSREAMRSRSSERNAPSDGGVRQHRAGIREIFVCNGVPEDCPFRSNIQRLKGERDREVRDRRTVVPRNPDAALGPPAGL